MSIHEYGPEYVASCFSLYLKSPFPRKLGYNPREIEHRGTSSKFKLGTRNCVLFFGRKSGSEELSSILEISEGEISEAFEIPSHKIKRSKTGKISGNTYEGCSDFFMLVCRKSEQFGKNIELSSK